MAMTKKLIYGLVLAGAAHLSAFGQTANVPGEPSVKDNGKQKVVVVTGTRFSYKLVQRWIDEFNKQYPDVQVIIEARGSSDPLKYDVLAEVDEHDEKTKQGREYIHVGMYAIFPVATARSQFAKIYGEKGLDSKMIKQIFFHNIFADQEEAEKIHAPYTIYTRFQKAGAPKVFAKFYDFEQKDINGKAIAGSDEHLLKALLRDSTGITYLPLPLIYDIDSGKPVDGLAVIPVDLDGNGRVKDDERDIYGNLASVTQALEAESKEEKNLPIDYLHLSVDRKKASVEAVMFLKWVAENGQKYLNDYGYLKAAPIGRENKEFNEFASKRGL